LRGYSQLFLAYDWPGNVRELRNAIESAVLLARGDLIQVGDLPACLVKRLIERDSKATVRPETPPRRSDWKQKIIAALAKTGGRREQAAILLGTSRTTLWRKMKELGLND
jgi:transcriptional regulator of acetoin/glycerol metabolism